MAHKSFAIDSIGTVRVYKNRRAKSIRLRVQPDREIKVTIPYWLPYAAGTRFVEAKKSWIKQQLPQQVRFEHDAVVGKQHRLVYRYNNNLADAKVRLRGTELVVELPFGYEHTNTSLHEAISKTAEKALRAEAKQYLPQRLAELATSHNFDFNQVRIKKMKSRWGSCSSNKDISLNIYLMQLDDELIDYVLLHELVHTRIQAHGKAFWEELALYVPGLQVIRQRMRTEEPRIIPR